MPLPSIRTQLAVQLVAWLTGTQTKAPTYVDANGNLMVTLGGTGASAGAASQGTKTADATNAWPVRLYNATAALLGRTAAAGSLPVVLSTEDLAVLSPQDFVPVVQSDSTTLTGVLGVRVTATGTLVVKNAAGTSRTFTIVAVPEYIPMSGITKIMDTGTTIADADLSVAKAAAA